MVNFHKQISNDTNLNNDNKIEVIKEIHKYEDSNSEEYIVSFATQHYHNGFQKSSEILKFFKISEKTNGKKYTNSICM